MQPARESSRCEAQCTSLGTACIGFSMHKSLPLCFLISRVCADSEATYLADCLRQLSWKPLGCFILK